jgi:hypothetical protein
MKGHVWKSPERVCNLSKRMQARVSKEAGRD